MLVILRVTATFYEQGLLVGLTIGVVVGLEALVAGPLCASMNPARSLAPVLVSGHLKAAWVYVVAPIAGVLLAVVADKLLELRVPTEEAAAKHQNNPHCGVPNESPEGAAIRYPAALVTSCVSPLFSNCCRPQKSAPPAGEALFFYSLRGNYGIGVGAGVYSNLNSTRRLRPMPTGDVFGAAGSLSPRPSVMMRLASTPFLVK